MLTLSQNTFELIQADSKAEFERKLDEHLSGDFPLWASASKDIKQSQIQRIIEQGKRAGMRVESDYAIFSQIIVSAYRGTYGDFSSVLWHPDVQSILKQNLSVPDKLLHLEHMLDDNR